MDLIETTIDDIIFWPTENQTLVETDPRICVYDPTGLGGQGLCKTNIGYYINACGMTYAEIKKPDNVMNFYLRFQIRNTCHTALDGEPVTGQYCAAWAEDWSRYPLSPQPHKFDVSKLCTTMYYNGDPTQMALGCKNNFGPYSIESDADWLEWYACQNPNDPGAAVACEANQFARQTGWSWQVLTQMTDLVLQNGNDCQRWFEGEKINHSPSTWQSLCEDGGSPAPAEHIVLSTLQTFKGFTARYGSPYDPHAAYVPPPPAAASPPTASPAPAGSPSAPEGSPSAPAGSPSAPGPPPLVLSSSSSNNPIDGPGTAGPGNFAGSSMSAAGRYTLAVPLLAALALVLAVLMA